MSTNQSNSGGCILPIIVFGGGFWLLGFLNNYNRQFQPSTNSAPSTYAPPASQNGTNYNDVLRETVRQSGETTRSMMQPQQYAQPDFSQLQLQQPSQSQTQCITGQDYLGRIVTQCEQN
jgi:hypothetical protein